MDELVLPHIRAHVVDGRVVVDVDDDDELFDFVEDELIERSGLEHEYVVSLESREQRRIVYPATTAPGSVFAALRLIDPAELQRVYRLNNS